MNNAAMKHAIRLVSSSLAIMAIFSGAVTAQAAEASSTDAASFKGVTRAAITAGLTGAKGSAGTLGTMSAIAVKKEATTPKEAVAVKKYPFSLDMDIATDPGYGHMHPGGTGYNDQQIKTMWTNLPITVEDENGNKIEAKKELQSGWERLAGNFAEGQKLTITIDARGIPEGYHISYDRDRTYIPAKGYSKFTVTYKLDDGRSIPLRISFGKLNVKFDLQGGNIDGKTDAITNTVKTDNTVDFPADPTKENLVFGGWYTEFPDIEAYQQRGIVGKRRYWTNKSLFSDTSCDVPQWNDKTLDPLGDYQFLLRAQWNAKVSFNANGGVFRNGKRELSGSIQQGKSIKMLDAPAREDYQFLNWADGAGNTYKSGYEYTLNANVAFTAQWKQIRSTVTFKDGDKTQTVKVETGKAIDTDELADQSMPKAPTKDGYTFKEWNTKADGTGTAFTGASVVNADTTVYAIYSLNMAQINTPATLELRDKTITQGDNLDLMSLVVSAKDTEDGDLTKDVKLVDNGGFDKDKDGTYIVTFKVTDKGGASVAKHATVTVLEKAVPQGASATTPLQTGTKVVSQAASATAVPQTGDSAKSVLQGASATAVPQTGDSANGLLYAALMGLPGVSLLATGLRKRRKQR